MQLELFKNEPFSIRITIESAMQIFWETYWKKLPSGKASRANIKKILRFFKGRSLDAISQYDVLEFRRALLAEGLSFSTVNRAQMVLSRLFTKMQEYKRIGKIGEMDLSSITLPEVNPCSLVPKPSETILAREVVLSPDEFKALRQYADEDLKDVLNMLIWTKLRQSDIRKMTSTNVNWSTMQIKGIQSKTVTTRNPGGVPYFVPIPLEYGKNGRRIQSPLEEVLRRRIARVKPGTSLFNWVNMQKRWNKVRKASGFLFVQMRDLRRSAAVYTFDNGQDEISVSRSLHHTTTRMTRNYLPRRRKHLEASVGILTKAF